MKIKENDKVLIASDDALFAPYKGKVCTVKRIYPDVVPPIAFVEIEDDPTIARTVGLKVPIADLVLIPGEPESEIPAADGAREISKADFDAALGAITSPERVYSNDKIDPSKLFFAAMTTMVVGIKISAKLFENQSSIIVTEDQFIAALWDACNPVNVSDFIDKKMSARNTAHTSLTTALDLLKIVPIFFGESEK